MLFFSEGNPRFVPGDCFNDPKVFLFGEVKSYEVSQICMPLNIFVVFKEAIQYYNKKRQERK